MTETPGIGTVRLYDGDRRTSLCWVDARGATRIQYRGVHLNTLTDEVQSIPPKARTY